VAPGFYNIPWSHSPVTGEVILTPVGGRHLCLTFSLISEMTLYERKTITAQGYVAVERKVFSEEQVVVERFVRRVTPQDLLDATLPPDFFETTCSVVEEEGTAADVSGEGEVGSTEPEPEPMDSTEEVEVTPVEVPAATSEPLTEACCATPGEAPGPESEAELVLHLEESEGELVDPELVLRMEASSLEDTESSTSASDVHQGASDTPPCGTSSPGSTRPRPRQEEPTRQRPRHEESTESEGAGRASGRPGQVPPFAESREQRNQRRNYWRHQRRLRARSRRWVVVDETGGSDEGTAPPSPGH
jgi:hypothetical protein